MGFCIPASKFADIEVFSLQLAFSVIYCITLSSTCLNSSPLWQFMAGQQFPVKYYFKMRGVICHRMAQVVGLLPRVRSDVGSIRGSRKKNKQTNKPTKNNSCWNLDGFIWRLCLMSLVHFGTSHHLPHFCQFPTFTFYLHTTFCTPSTSSGFSKSMRHN